MTKNPEGVRPLQGKRGLTPDQVLDCYGLVCPVPVRKTAEAIEALQVGQILQVISTDDWFDPDLEAWLQRQPHDLLKIEKFGQETHAYLRRNKPGTSH